MYTSCLEKHSFFLLTLIDCKNNYLQWDNWDFNINIHFYWKLSLIARLILITCTLKFKTTCFKIIMFTFYRFTIMFLQVVRVVVVVTQLLSCVQPFVTPWTPAHQASLSFTLSWSLLRIMFIESVMLFNYHPLPPSSLLAFSLSQDQGLFQWVDSSHQVAKVLGLQL